MREKIDAYTEALKSFQTLDPEVMAVNAGAKYDPLEQVFTLKYCNSFYKISYPDGIVTEYPDSLSLNKNERSLILMYLTQANGLPPRDNWVSFLEIEGGPAHYAPLVKEAFEPLAKVFGNKPEKFKEICLKLGGELTSIGDLGYKFDVLPKITMAIILYLEDEEFPAKVNIIFDKLAETHLPMAPLWVMTVEFSKKIRRLAGVEVIEQIF